MESKGFTVAAFNRTVSKVDDFVNGRAKGKNILGARSVEEFVSLLKRPRKVMIMVKAGKAVDDFIEQILQHLEPGDILIDGGEIAGDGVNVAARLEALAEPGEIAISAAIREQVRQLKSVQLVDAGHHRVKNLKRPIRVYKVRVQGSNRVAALKRLRRRLPTRALLAALAVAVAVGALLVLAPWAGREVERRSLAVLPIQSNAGEAGNALARSLTADTTMTLAQMLGGAVAAPSAVATVSKQTSDPTVLGARLRVRYLLEGEVEQNGSEIRLQVRLLDAVTGRQLWSNRLTATAGAGEPVPLELIGPLVNKVASEIRRTELARHGTTGADATEE
jgi:TolB-like protein